MAREGGEGAGTDEGEGAGADEGAGAGAGERADEGASSSADEGASVDRDRVAEAALSLIATGGIRSVTPSAVARHLRIPRERLSREYPDDAAIAAALATLVIYQLPDDWFDRYRESVRSVTTSDVLTAAQRHLHPEALQMLVVGNPSAIQAPLEAIGFGPLSLYDAEGRPTRR